MAIGMVAVLALPVIMLILVMGVVAIVRLLVGRRDSQMLRREERDQLRKLDALLERMEERISNLETILMTRDKRDRDKQGDQH